MAQTSNDLAEIAQTKPAAVSDPGPIQQSARDAQVSKLVCRYCAAPWRSTPQSVIAVEWRIRRRGSEQSVRNCDLCHRGAGLHDVLVLAGPLGIS